MKNSIQITQTQLIEMLKNWKFGAQPVSIQYITEPKLTAFGKNTFGKIVKYANVSGMVGYVYENSVNNQLEREGKEKEFLAGKLWNGAGERVTTALSRHIAKDVYYMTFKHQKTLRSYSFDTDMNLIAKEILSDCFPSSIPTNQGVNEGKEIYHREISICNIKRFKCRKTTYEIVGR